MKTPTKLMLVSLILVMIALSGCYYQAESAEEGAEGEEEQVSYLDDVDEVDLDDSDDEEEADEEDDTETQEAEDDEEEEQETAPPQKSGSAVTVYEGEKVQLQVRGSDPDGDPISYTFSAPLDENGMWQTEEGDAGDYLVTVTASDGKTQSSKTLKISVLQRNAPPVISGLSDVTVREGETVSLDPQVSDNDGDEVTVSYSGWMTSSSKKTGYDDSGKYDVTVTASDGKSQTNEEVQITVLDVNRAPEFEIVVS
ncbi:hypothetical protein GF345_03275 [Candidatus Woesearchaeota archaeon]|nr:hypothetical protein [Candidatus Woesearchaeota archaeon]